jgi:hypothetical protein
MGQLIASFWSLHLVSHLVIATSILRRGLESSRLHRTFGAKTTTPGWVQAVARSRRLSGEIVGDPWEAYLAYGVRSRRPGKR